MSKYYNRSNRGNKKLRRHKVMDNIITSKYLKYVMYVRVASLPKSGWRSAAATRTNWKTVLTCQEIQELQEKPILVSMKLPRTKFFFIFLYESLLSFPLHSASQLEITPKADPKSWYWFSPIIATQFFSGQTNKKHTSTNKSLIRV